MARHIHAVACAVLMLASMAQAAPDPSAADEQAFLEKHISDIVTTTTKRLTDPAITKIMAVPVYELTISIASGDGKQTSTQLAIRSNDKLVPLNRPGTTEECPGMLKMIKPGFKLKTDADAAQLQAVLNALYPVFMESDKASIAMTHSGKDWTFIRGKFFEKHEGFVFTTDDAGKVTQVKFSLELP